MYKEKTLQKFNHIYSAIVNNKECYFLHIVFLLFYSLIIVGCQKTTNNEEVEPLSIVLEAEQVFSESDSHLEIQEIQQRLSNLAEKVQSLNPTAQQEICDHLTSFSDEILSNFQEFLAKTGLTCSLDLLARIDHFSQFNPNATAQTRPTQNTCVDHNGHFRMKYLSIRSQSYIDGLDLPYGHLALTFNDGPNSQFTIRLLNILDSRSAKATFFMIGKNVEQLPNIALQVANRGHSIGSHSYNHRRLNSTRNALSDVFRGHNILLSKLSNHTSVKPFFRSPFGALNSNLKNAVLRNGLSIFAWTIDTRDRDISNPNRLLQNTWQQITQNNHRGILLFHESEQTIRIMPGLLESIANSGFCLVLFY